MSFCTSENPAIAASMAAMRDLVVAHGGQVNPSACIEEQDGNLRVLCGEDSATGTPLFRVPNALLVPVDDLSWMPGTGELRLIEDPAGLTALQQEMLGHFIAIYNATGKMEWMSRHPSMAIREDAALLAELRRIVPVDHIDTRTAAASFLATRYYSSSDVPGGLAGKCLLMPLIDFANHGDAGARFDHTEAGLGVAVARTYATDECFIRYNGHFDPMELALSYGYGDPRAPFGASVPLAVALPLFGRLSVTARFHGSDHSSKPPKVEFGDGGVTLSHLVVDTRAPDVARTFLCMALTASGKRRGIGEAAIARAIAEAPLAILAENRTRIAAFQSYLQTRADLPCAALLAGASECQLANLTAALAPLGTVSAG